jgi:gamma-glutamyl-gamma-aminobutyrate hydrolase PuuD
LIRTCCIHHKPVFGLGFGMNILVLYSNTGLPSDVEFIPKQSKQEKDGAMGIESG